MARFSAYRPFWFGALFICLLVLLLAASGAWAGMNTGPSEITPKPKPELRGPEPTYSVEAGLHGDLFPVFANYASSQDVHDRKLGTVTITVTNSSSERLRNRISVQIPGWSESEIQIVELGAGQAHQYRFAPSFLPRLYQNRELMPATAVVTVTDMAGRTVFTSTAPLRIRSIEDMYWGTDFKYAPFIASWVTPHDSRVEAVLARAKEFMPGRRLPGYESERPIAVQQRSTLAQVRAIYRAVQATGLSYVKSSGTYGARSNAEMAERVRLPNESLARVSANCIDGVVLYASLFENLGMEPVVVLVPGHAYVGIRLTENSRDYLYLETALTGRAGFDIATQTAQRGIGKYSSKQILRIPIAQARETGIFPMPNPGGREGALLRSSR
jgi:hypothetical protein